MSQTTEVRTNLLSPADRGWAQCAAGLPTCPVMADYVSDNLRQFANSQSQQVLEQHRAWLSDELQRFSGPPIWELRTLEDVEILDVADYFAFVLRVPLPDANNPKVVFPVGRLCYTEAPVNAPRGYADAAISQLRRDVRKTFQALVLHEVDEWLRHDGTHVADPHPERN